MVVLSAGMSVEGNTEVWAVTGTTVGSVVVDNSAAIVLVSTGTALATDAIAEFAVVVVSGGVVVVDVVVVGRFVVVVVVGTTVVEVVLGVVVLTSSINGRNSPG